tara:strand:+ start:417 stop:749 length:333 start_codon:yes stop_codon:yes gene_type:complete
MPVLDRTYDILGREFDLDELKDVANYGASQGVPGFIYYSELRDIFDDNDDEIQDYLSDWVHDNIGDGESSFSYFAKDVEDITQLKGKLVWAYLELKAYECLVDAKHPDFY